MTRRFLAVNAFALTLALSSVAYTQTPLQNQPPTVGSLLDEAKVAADQQRFDDAKRLLQQALVLIDAQQAALVAAQPAAVTTTVSREPMRVSPGSFPGPKLIGSKAKPIYPRAAIEARVQGIVYLDVIVGKDGAVRDALVISGPELLQKAAIDAVRQWRYSPTRLNNEPIEVVFSVNVIFQLGGERQPTAEITDRPVYGGVPEPKLIGPKVKPIYPALAEAAKVQGIVYVEITVGKDGKVKEARVLRGPQLLHEAALTAVRQWVYEPTLLNGRPVDVVFTVNVLFSL